VTGRVHSTNGHGYRYGSSLQVAARLDYRVVERVALEAGVDGRHALRDTVDGVDQENTGGLVVAAAPGVAVNVAGDVWLRARAQIPVITSLFGDQSVGVTIFASAQILLH
jgi:hypothetical protein